MLKKGYERDGGKKTDPQKQTQKRGLYSPRKEVETGGKEKGTKNPGRAVLHEDL